ncbi:hypothetical protein BJ508DRAFT_120622 [Ascobolus immersus RN42]|uniref:Uncharacterized protein n=1 Tax=Ascobolus immersus RN42 TaxID=1160509 RepID=A0A3N4IRG2_ASCIM|nr:hypothetical protein BJ508DRAFT_120622 [Ascobolus immersus RN42]
MPSKPPPDRNDWTSTPIPPECIPLDAPWHSQQNSTHPPTSPHYLSPTDPALYALPTIHSRHNTASALRVLRYFAQCRVYPPPTPENLCAPSSVRVLHDSLEKGELVFVTSFGLLVNIVERRKSNGERHAFVKSLTLYGNIGDSDEGDGTDWRRQWEEVRSDPLFARLEAGHYFGSKVLRSKVGVKTLRIEQGNGAVQVLCEEKSGKKVFPAVEGTQEPAGLQSYCRNTFRHFVRWLGWGRRIEFPARWNNEATLDDDDLEEEFFEDVEEEEERVLSPSLGDEDAYACWLIEGVLLAAALVLEPDEVVEKVLFDVASYDYWEQWVFLGMEIRRGDPGLGVVRFLEEMDDKIHSLQSRISMGYNYSNLVQDGGRQEVDGYTAESDR